MAYETLTVETREHVSYITLERPETGNLVDRQMARDLREACTEVQEDDTVRVVVLQARGDTFCKGSALQVPNGADGASVEMVREALADHRAAESVARITKPVIAVLQGDALDQGLELALACDLRVASVGIRMGFPQAREGLLPWDGGTQRLLRLGGASRAMDLLMTGRLLDADEGYAAGLVNAISTPEDLAGRVGEVVSAVAGTAPIAAQYAKEAVLRGLDMTLVDGLRLEADMNFLLFTTADREEGIRSFLERRHPEYRGE